MKHCSTSRTISSALVVALTLLVAVAKAEDAAPAADASPAPPTPPPPFDGETFIAYVALVVLAMTPIYVGAKRSLAAIGAGGVTKDEHTGEIQNVEAMTRRDAYMFPVMGSAVLFSMYLAFKFLSKDAINFLFMFYFALIGLFSVADAFVVPMLEALLPRASALSRAKHTFRFNFQFWDSSAAPSTLTLSSLQLLACVATAPLIGWYMATKHWIASNVLGLAFSIEGVRYMSLGTYSTGALLLSLLFFYDVFWVFGTEVMVSVAKSFDAPIKVLFPRALLSDPNNVKKLAMLGLGDIVLPGVFLALLLRFDHFRSGGASAVYFNVTFFAYAVGLVTTIVVMTVFHAAQPALLYLVPAVLLASAGTAIARGELSKLLEYDEGAPAAAAAAETSAATAKESTAAGGAREAVVADKKE